MLAPLAGRNKLAEGTYSKLHVHILLDSQHGPTRMDSHHDVVMGQKPLILTTYLVNKTPEEHSL